MEIVEERFRPILVTKGRKTGKASLVTDEKLNQKISQLKYPGEKRADEKRVAIEVTLDSVNE